GVDVGVVDDLANEKEPAIRKLAARLVSVFDRPLHPVAEPKFPGEPYGKVVYDKRVRLGLQQVDDPPVVVRRQVLLDSRLEPETLSEISRWLVGRRRRHGCKSSDAFIG